MRSYRALHLVCATAAAAVVTGTGLMPSPASAAYISVYGSPIYTVGIGGYQGGDVPVGPGGGVNDAGAAIGYADKYEPSGAYAGARAVRWTGTTAIELGNLGTSTGGITNSQAYAINSAGTVVGLATKYDGSGVNKGERAVRWDAAGIATELGNLGTSAGGSTNATAHGVNTAGTTVGYADKYDGAGNYKGARPARWDSSGTAATELGTLGTSSNGDASGQGYAINTGGTAVGYVDTFDGSGTYKGFRAVRWDGSGTAATELEHLGTDPNGVAVGEAYAINAAGTAVGWARKYDGSGTQKGERAVRWDGSSTAVTELGNLGVNTSGETISFAYAVNSDGTAVGDAEKYDGSGNSLGSRAVRWDGGGTAATELGNLGTDTNGATFAVAFAVNNAGAAVGFAADYDGAGAWIGDRAVYWGVDGFALDLNTLIDPASGWTLREARAISDTGWISGTGLFDPDGAGGQAAYTRLFLVQVPEPTSLALLSLGGWAVLRRRRHPLQAARMNPHQKACSHHRCL